MITKLSQLLEQQTGKAKPRVAVAAAHDSHVLSAVNAAIGRGLADFTLLGDEERIRAIAKEAGLSLDGIDVIHLTEDALCAASAVEMVRRGEAQLIMKGLLDTAVVLKAVLNKDAGLRDSDNLSLVSLFEVPGFDRLLCVTDPGINIQPDVNAKQRIIENAATVLHALGNENPIVACLCAIERVNPKMQATLDAAELVERNRTGRIMGCTVAGPFALDNAVSPEAAAHKGIQNSSAGKADILLVPQIESGNMLYKALIYMARAKNAGVLMGAKVPLVMTSRADSDEAKLYSVALAIRMADYLQGGGK